MCSSAKQYCHKPHDITVMEVLFLKVFIMEHFRHSTVNPNVPISQLQQLSTHGWSCFICILPLPCHPHYSQPSYHFIHHYNWFKKVSEVMLKSSRSEWFVNENLLTVKSRMWRKWAPTCFQKEKGQTLIRGQKTTTGVVNNSTSLPLWSQMWYNCTCEYY